MKKLLAFFGAFNPPTRAHLELADFARRETGAERVIFVPSRADYIRNEQGKDYAYGNEERLAMLRRAAEGRLWMGVTDIEIRGAEQPRTYVTLCRLREEGTEASLLMGSDKLAEMETAWRYGREIAEEFGIVVLTRGADECGRMIRESAFLSGIAEHIRVLETPKETRMISSGAVRSRMKQIRELQKEIRDMVPEEILPML